MATLSLEEFRATRQESADVSMIFGDDDVNGPLPGWTYESSCICKDVLTGEPYLVIYNCMWADKPLEELEEILYREFYLPEICGQVLGS